MAFNEVSFTDIKETVIAINGLANRSKHGKIIKSYLQLGL